MPLTADRGRVGSFEFDLRAAELRRSGVTVRLQEQPLKVLIALLERPGEVVTREELRRRLWPADTYVDFERSLNAAVKRLREALGESADSPQYIETLPRRGYRLVALVEMTPVPAAEDPRVQDPAGHRPPSPSPGMHPRLWTAGGVAAAVLAVLGATAGLWFWLRPARQPPESISGLDPGKVVVGVFANATGDASLDALGLETCDRAWLSGGT
jgi:DNA-binding winged helix-turn-helix (wHTH) protein